MTRKIRIPLDGLGITHDAALELVNRMNANDDRKWVLESSHGWGQIANPASTSTCGVGLNNYYWVSL